MKKMLMALVGAMLTIGATTANAGALPNVGNGTEPNVWTSNVDGVFEAAKKTGYPIFLCMINDSSTGVGCSHCWSFVINTLNNPEWTRIVNTYKFYMVMINNGGYDEYSDYFAGQYFKFGGTGTLPLVQVFTSDGRPTQNYLQAQTEAVLFWRRLEEAISALSVFDTTLALASASTSNELKSDEVWNGKVTRTGGSGATGTVTLSLSGDYATEYTVTPAVIQWDSSDGEKTFTVARTAASSRIVSDSIVVNMTPSGFDGSTVTANSNAIALSFKDARVGYTLAQFAAATPGLAGLSPVEDAVWFTPATADGRVLETVTDKAASLAWTATQGGILTVASDGSAIAVGGSAGSFTLTDTATTIGVAPGDVISFTTSAPDATAGVATFGFSQMSFQPTSLVLSVPENNAQIPYAELAANPALLTFQWASSATSATYDFYATQAGEAAVFSGEPFVAGTTATTMTGLETGFVSADFVPMGDCWWGIRVADRGVEHGMAVALATAKFSLSAQAEFPEDTPTSVTAYVKAGHAFDFSARSTSETVTYSAKGLPQGMAINKSTGVVTGSPRKAGKHTVTITAKNEYGETSITVAFTAAKFPKSAVCNYNGLLFTADGAVSGTATWRIASNAKWTASVAVGTGKKTTVKGTVTFDEAGRMYLMSSTLNMSPVEGYGIWAGDWNGNIVYGKATPKSVSYTGTWNSGFTVEGGANPIGYVTAKVARNGKVAIKGKVYGKQSITGSSTGVLFPAAFVRDYLPTWYTGSDAFLAHGAKASFSGGVALYADSSMGGRFSYNGISCETIGGGKWDSSYLTALNGKWLKVLDDGTTFEVSATASRAVAVATPETKEIRARFSAGKRTGVFTGLYTNSAGTCKFEGALYSVGGEVYGAGAGMIGNSVPVSAIVE